MPADRVLATLNEIWKERLKTAENARQPWDDQGDLCQTLYASDDYGDVFDKLNIEIHQQDFCVGFNKVAEFVDIMTGHLYYHNPNRLVLARHEAVHDPTAVAPGQGGMPMLSPQAQQSQVVATLVGKPLQFTPEAHDLRWHSQQAIQQALIRGRGCLWTEIDEFTGLPGSFFGDAKELFYDPDARVAKNAWWIARQRWAPAWALREWWGLLPEELEGAHLSTNAESVARAHKRFRLTDSSDDVPYWEIYSRMGLGGRLENKASELERLEQGYRQAGVIGDYVYLVIVPSATCNRPLNVSGRMNGEQLSAALDWPIPLYRDGKWPVSSLEFRPLADSPDPRSPISPALGELTFFQWLWTHLANKIPTTMRDFVALATELSNKVKDKILHGSDLFAIELSNDQLARLDTLVQFIQHPELQRTPLEMLQMVENMIDRRLGLDEIMTGQMSKQIRTTTEAMARTEATRVRPDKMSGDIDAWQSEAARKEALVLRTSYVARDPGSGALTTLGRVLGGPLEAMAWDSQVRAEWETAGLELDYKIEAGSVRRPDKTKQGDDAHILGQLLMPFAQARSNALGDNRMLNGLLKILAKAMDFASLEDLLLPPMETPSLLMAMGQGAGAGAGGGQTGLPVGSQMPGAGVAGQVPGMPQGGLQHRRPGNTNATFSGRPVA